MQDGDGNDRLIRVFLMSPNSHIASKKRIGLARPAYLCGILVMEADAPSLGTLMCSPIYRSTRSSAPVGSRRGMGPRALGPELGAF